MAKQFSPERVAADVAALSDLSRESSRSRADNVTNRSLLGGLIFDETGDRLTPTHAVKKSGRYRYYISQRLMQKRKKDTSGWRLPAKELEGRVLRAVADTLIDNRQLHDLLGLEGRDVQAFATAMQCAKEMARTLVEGHSPEAAASLRLVVTRIDIAPGEMKLTLSRLGLWRALQIEDRIKGHQPEVSASTISLPFEIRRRGIEAKIVIENDPQPVAHIDRVLVDTVVKAREWLHLVTTGGHKSIADAARTIGIDDGEISRVLPLAFLAPDIVEAIVQGLQPITLTARRLKRLKPLPPLWVEQQRVTWKRL